MDDKGSIIYSEFVKCPYCDHEDEKLGIGKGKSMGKVECEACEGKFRIDWEEETQMYIMEKCLK